MALIVITCPASWGSDVRDDGTKGHLDGNDFAGNDASEFVWRWAQKIDIRALAGTIAKVELRVNVVTVPGATGDWDIGPYGSDGTDDPEADSGATMFTRCSNTGQYVNDTSVFDTAGVKTLDLGAQAIADLQAALTAEAGFFSVACVFLDPFTVDAGAAIEEYSGGSSPPVLLVTVEGASGKGDAPLRGTVPRQWRERARARASLSQKHRTGDADEALATAFADWFFGDAGSGAITLTPAALVLPLVLPSPSLLASLALTPAATAVPIAAPAPVVALQLALAPGALALPIALPAPALALTLALSPAVTAIPVALPAPAVSVAGNATLSPGALAVGLAVPAPTLVLQLGLAPSPLALGLAAPAPALSRELDLSPAPVALPIALPAPVVAQDGGPITLSPSPLAFALTAPAPVVGLSLTISPAAAALTLGLPIPALAAALAITPAAQALALALPAPARSSTLALSPGAHAVPLVLPAPALALRLTLAPGPLGVVLSAPAPLIAQSQQIAPLPLVLVLSAPTPEVLTQLASTLTEAIRDLLVADGELVGLLASYDPLGSGPAAPAVFTDPIPEGVVAPFVVLTGEISQEPTLDQNDGSMGRSVVFDVRFYAAETGSRALFEQIAWRIRAVLHRQPLRVAGCEWVDSRARGPVPVDEVDLYGAVISLRVLLDG